MTTKGKEFHIQSFYETIIKLRRPYCPLCFKTDVKFTKPVNAKILLLAVKKHDLLTKRNRVCVWCESASRRALSLLSLLDAAAEIHSEIAYWQQDRGKHSQWQKLKTLQSSVEKHWSTNNLMLTNILLVDSNGVQRIEARSETGVPIDVNESDPSSATLTRVHLPRPPPATAPEPPSPPLLVPLPQLLETKNLSRDVRIASLLADRSQMIVRDGASPDTFTLHPAISMNDGTLVVPTLNLVIDTSGHSLVMPQGNNQTVIPVIQQVSGAQNQNNNIPPVIQIAPSGIQVKPLSQMSQVNKVFAVNQVSPLNQLKNSMNLISNSAGTSSGNSDSSAFVNTSVGSSNTLTLMPKNLSNNNSNSEKGDKNVSAKTKRRRRIDSRSSASKKSCTPELYIDLDTIQDLIDEKIGKKTEDCEQQDGGGPASAAKQAVPKSGKIDWEDKIPMDVISFVDATDPNAADIMNPKKDPINPGGVVDPLETEPPRPPPPPLTCNPFGVISHVRSEQPTPTLQPPPIEDGTIRIIIEPDSDEEETRIAAANIEETYIEEPTPVSAVRIEETKETSDRNSPEFIVSDCGRDERGIIRGAQSKIIQDVKDWSMQENEVCDVIDLC